MAPALYLPVTCYICTYVSKMGSPAQDHLSACLLLQELWPRCTLMLLQFRGRPSPLLGFLPLPFCCHPHHSNDSSYYTTYNARKLFKPTPVSVSRKRPSNCTYSNGGVIQRSHLEQPVHRVGREEKTHIKPAHVVTRSQAAGCKLPTVVAHTHTTPMP